MARRFASYSEFWAFYLSQHSRRGTRALHYAGTVGALALVAFALAAREWAMLPVAVVAGYGLAWIGHFAVERNLPATFGHPLWSLISDLRMLGLAATGRLGPELERRGVG
jgi:hypothetical protein